MEADPGAGFKKLNFLISSGNFPPETFGNLLLLYCAPAHQFYDLAADVMAENPAYCQELLSKVGGTLFVSLGGGGGGGPAKAVLYRLPPLPVHLAPSCSPNQHRSCVGWKHPL
jgi:hypothetical protein